MAFFSGSIAASMRDLRQRELVKVVRRYFKKSGRHDLPWRKVQTPYRVFVSEVMLQQTQVERVIPKFNAFIKRFPNVVALAKADLRDVYALWAGLGYNRRARYLRDAAKIIQEKYKGSVPKSKAALIELPGIGTYTACAISTFAYGDPEAFVETNLRTVVLHHCFKDTVAISDERILGILRELEPNSGKDAKDWYAALMDYGAYLKSQGIRLNSRSAHYAKQSAFKGSLREVRGALLREVAKKRLTESALKVLPFSATQKKKALLALCREGMLEQKRGAWVLAK